MTNKEEADPTESQIVRASVLESHGWSSEANRSQCKLRVQEIHSFVFCYILFFLFVWATPFFTLRDTVYSSLLDFTCAPSKRFLKGNFVNWLAWLSPMLKLLLIRLIIKDFNQVIRWKVPITFARHFVRERDWS